MTIKVQKEVAEKALLMKQGASTTSIPENRKRNVDDAAASHKEAAERAYVTKHGPPRVLIRDTDVAEMIGASRTTVWRRCADGSLPRPIKFGGMTRWVFSEVEAAIARQVAARDAQAA